VTPIGLADAGRGARRRGAQHRVVPASLPPGGRYAAFADPDRRFLDTQAAA
jgi:hypothetical protein